MIIILSGCQGDSYQILFKKPKYEADFRQIEQILNYLDRGNYKASLSENEKLERRYDDSINSSPDYSRVIVSFARMNAMLLGKVIKDKNALDKQSKKLNIKIDELTRELKGMNTALKTIEDLKVENKTLRQQIEDFKKIDFQSDEIDSSKRQN